MRSVAVVGAGAAGLVTAREVLRRNLRVTVFEQASAIGGVWVYTPEVEGDPLGQNCQRIHASLYASLRTNLPRDLMAYSDYPFDSAGGGDDTWPRFPGHVLVRTYLERFANDFELTPHIQFDSRVDLLEPRGSGWSLTAQRNGRTATFDFDAVAVCSGHFTVPRVPQLPGADAFPGHQSHSHNYRDPSRFAGKRVALLGTSASGLDLSREIATVADTVYWCGTLFDALPEAQRDSGNLHRVASIKALLPSGQLRLRDGTVTDAVDELVYCTGYHYQYPFLSPKLLSIEDNWVQPLYRDVLHIEHPTLAFIGIPFRVIPFPLFEMQARWFTQLLTGAFELPSPAQLQAHAQAEIDALRARGVKQRHFHQRTIDCFDYLDALADQAGIQRAPKWRRQLAAALLRHMQQAPGPLRDARLPHFGPTVVPEESIRGD